MSNSPSRASAPVESATVESASAAAKIDFTAEESAKIARYAHHVVEASVRAGSITEPLPADLADAPGFGVFVSIKRKGGILRGCRGQWGGQYTLAQLVTSSANDSALRDTRFPTVCGDELEYLGVEVSLMYDARKVAAVGADRIDAVVVGQHGLVISHPRGRGLLLPQVATEAGWDSATFLEHLCQKASLPTGTWREDAAELMTFQARIMNSQPAVDEFDARTLEPAILERMVQIANRTLLDPSAEFANEAPVLTAAHPEPLGVFLRTRAGTTMLSMGPNRTLLALTRSAARALKDRLANPGRDPQAVAGLVVLTRPISLVPGDYPNRHGTLARSAVLSQQGGRWALAFGNAATPDPVALALQSIGRSAIDWQYDASRSIALTAFTPWFHPSASIPGLAAPATVSASPAPDHSVRPAARAGQFYPADASEMAAQVTKYLGEADPIRSPESYRAVMLPHAGWSYCGSTLGKTIGRVKVPDTVIVIGPKHTPYGANWSVSPAQEWRFPGFTVPIATDLRARLLEFVEEMHSEPAAHQFEHAVEVIVPFLYQLNPSIRLLPIVLGMSTYEQTGPLASALGRILKQESKPPLLVISSDMNHFAAEPENRRRDFLALDAMRTGAARKLFETVRSNDISMCGVLPAVTVMQCLAEQSTNPLALELVDYTNSGLVTGDQSRVVGYAGMLLK